MNFAKNISLDREHLMSIWKYKKSARDHPLLQINLLPFKSEWAYFMFASCDICIETNIVLVVC